MKYRVNFLRIVNEEIRGSSRVIEANTPDEAKNKCEKTLTETYGKDEFRITATKPW